MFDRRRFLGQAAGLAAGLAWPGPAAARPRLQGKPKLNFYGSTRQVSGSCHLLECSKGLFLVDCGLFYDDLPDADKENHEFPFDPKEVKGLFLTHAHIDHTGRLPFLYAKGFRGQVFCTDATRDLSRVMLGMSLSVAAGQESEGEPLGSNEDLEGFLKLISVVPYNTKVDRAGLTFRFTDAGHILGSAMVEVWVDGVKILFGGDMGPDYTPLLCKPTQHFGADAVLVESTYGPAPRDFVGYEEFGKRVQKVIDGGGSVLLPAFALHKTQTLIYVLNQLAQDKIIDPKVPIYSDSSTAQQCTMLYNKYTEYHDTEARERAKKNKGSFFYTGGYRERGIEECLGTHGRQPAIYISTSGMLEHGASPRHLEKMAGDEKNAVFLVGYQSPASIGKQLERGAKKIDIPISELDKETGKFKRRTVETEIKLQIEKVGGFSSHARGQQILEWVERFKEIGALYVVHGDLERSTGLADAAKKMGVNAHAPERGETFEVTPGTRVKPGPVPPLQNAKPPEPAPVDK